MILKIYLGTEEWITEMINNILIEVLSSMAEQERLTIRKRQKQGIEAAKAIIKDIASKVVIINTTSLLFLVREATTELCET